MTQQLFICEFDPDVKSEIESNLVDQGSSVQDVRFVKKSNLDGEAATWIVMATIAGQALPHLLTFLSDILERRAVKSIEYDGIKIENPSKEDLEEFRKRRDGNDDTHDKS